MGRDNKLCNTKIKPNYYPNGNTDNTQRLEMYAKYNNTTLVKRSGMLSGISVNDSGWMQTKWTHLECHADKQEEEDCFNHREFFWWRGRAKCVDGYKNLLFIRVARMVLLACAVCTDVFNGYMFDLNDLLCPNVSASSIWIIYFELSPILYDLKWLF